MSNNILFFGMAAIMAGLIPLMPGIIRFRIFLLRKLHLRWLADWHLRYFDGIVIAGRTIVTVAALILLGLGIDSLS